MKTFLYCLSFLSVLLLAGPLHAQQYTWSTYAGQAGISGTADGTGANARFNTPHGVALDSAGNLFVADRNNQTIRRITPAQVVSTFVGQVGVGGSTDGTGTGARFNLPHSGAFDSAGNLIICDNANNTIRQITPAGVVTTIAGIAGVGGSTDDNGLLAQFLGPEGVAIDSAGNLFVTDAQNATIRKITPTGDVTTFAGTAGVRGATDGNGAAAEFQFPATLGIDAADNLYVADRNNHSIRKITPGGDVTTFAGTSGSGGTADGLGAAAQFNQPNGVAVDANGNIFVGCIGSHQIRMITPAGLVTTIGGSTAGAAGSTDGVGTAARFDKPNYLAVDAAGNVYVADANNFTIRKGTPPSAGTAPTITAQPQPASQTVGGSVSLVVSANGTLPLAYQWFFTNGPVSGATNPTFTFNPAQLTNSGNYFVVITNVFGSITSSPALLTVTNSTAPPTITTQPLTQTVIRSNNVTFFVSVSGALPLTYQWFFNSNAVGGATAPSLTLNNVQTNAAGDYIVIVTNSFGSTTSSIATLTVLTNPAAPPFQWAQAVGAAGGDHSEAVAVDSAGNAYVAMRFEGTVSIGGTNLTATGTPDSFIAKIAPNGACIWARVFGGPGGNTYATGIAVDPAGNVFVSGDQFGTTSFGTTNITSAGSSDMFIAKYNASGAFQWVRRFGSPSNDGAHRVATDAAGNVFAVGDINGPTTFGTNVLSPPQGGGVLVKLDPSGSVLWVRQGTAPGSSHRVAVDNNGNAFVVGAFAGTNSVGTNSLTSVAGSSDIVTAKYDPNGNLLWVRQAGGPGADVVGGIAVDAAGNSFLTGELSGSVAFGATNVVGLGSLDAFVAKYDATGNVVRVWQVGSPGLDRGRGVALDAAGNIYLHGDFTGLLNYGGLAVTNTFGGQDLFVLKMDGAGNPIWLKSAGGSAVDSSGNLAVAPNGDAYIVGGFNSTETFDSLSFTNAGSQDIYFAKIPAAAGPAPQPTGVIAWWNGNGHALDIVSTNNGSFGNGATTSAGKVGNAFDLTGSQAINIPDSAAWAFGTNNFSIELWANFRSLNVGGTGTLINGNAFVSHDSVPGPLPKWAFSLNGGELSFHVGETPGFRPFIAKSSFSPSLGQWYHFAVTREGNLFVIYVDGQPVAAESIVVNIPSAGTNLTIGAAEQQYFQGRLDEVTVYNRALALSEVQTIFTAGSLGKTPLSTATLLTQPQPLIVDQGAPAQMTVAAIGYAPFTYQWRLNGTNVPAQTNATLTIPAAYSVHEGSYDVRVTQFNGANVLSASATLNVLGQGEAKTLFAVMNDVVNFRRVGGAVTLPDGVVGWWKAEGNALDSFGNNHGAFFNGATTIAGGFVGRAFFLDGVDDYIAVPASPSLTFGSGASHSLEAWVFRTGSQLPFHVLGKRDASTDYFYQMGYDGNDPAIPLNTWVHLMDTYDGATYRRYYNGVLVRSFAQAPVANPPTTAELRIGTSGPFAPFPGLIDEATIYNRTLTPAEIQSLFNAGSAGKINPTVPWTLTSTNTLLVVPGTGNIQSTQSFGDFILHSEFLLPATGNGNSGIYLQNRYEIQIFNSFGVAVPGGNDIGAVWNQTPASTNAALPAGQWQTYDITFRQAQWNGNTKVANARVTVVLNGVTVQNETIITGPTTGGVAEGPTPGPVVLQDNGSAVQFRNLRITPLDLPPEFQRALSAGGTQDDSLLFQSRDAAGSTYLSGSFQGTTTIGTNVLVSSGLYDAYIAKVNASGTVLWARKVGSTGDESGFGVAAVANGDVFFCGRFQNTASFGTTNLTASGVGDLFLARYDSNGNLIWARKAGGPGDDTAYAVAADAAGNAYVAGEFNGTTDLGGIQFVSGSASGNGFVAKYGPTGALVWASALSGTGTTTNRKIRLDGATNVYVAGSFQGTIQFVTPFLSSAGSDDAFVLKLNSAGAAQWAQQFGAGASDAISALDLGPDGSVHVAGNFRGSVAFGTSTLNNIGSADVFTAKLDPSGNVLWARQAGGGGTAGASSLGVDAQGNVFVAGTFNNSATFSATPLASSGANDLFVVHYDANGIQRWVRSSSNGQNITGGEIATDSTGGILVSGEFLGSLALDSIPLSSLGQRDIFHARLVSTPPFISQQPVGGNVLAGQNATFNVAATGAGTLTYQWRLNGTNLAGATNAAFSIANATTNAAGTYDVLVTHAFGTIVSSPASITVIPSANPLPFNFAERYGGTGAESVQALARDAAGNSYLAGYFTGALNFGTTNLTSAGGDDIFVVKISPAGSVLWAAHCGGPGEDRATGLALDPNGDVVVVGWFDNNAVFGTNGAVGLAVNVASFTLRLNANGVLTGFHKIDFSGAGASVLKVRNFAVAVDATGGVYVAGKGDNTNNFGAFTFGRPGVWGYIVKYDRSGSVQWIQASDSTPGTSQNVLGMAVALDNAGGVFLGGFYGLPGGTSGTNAIIGGVTLPYGGGDSDAFVAKFTTATGAPVWTRGLHGAGAERVMRLATDPAGNVFASGDFDAPVDFGAGVLTPSNGANGTGLLLKLDAAGAVLWAREAGATDGLTKDNGALVTDAVGNVYLAHTFTGTSVLGSPAATSVGGRDVLVTKFGAGGNFLWAQTFGSTGDDFANGLVLDANFNLHVAGTLGGQAALGPFTLTNAGSTDLFLTSISSVAPIITTQPASQTIGVTQPVTFTVATTGTLPFTYQWRFNGTNLPGATNAIFTLPFAVPANGGSYSVLVGDALGITVSSSATLAVDTSSVPFITGQPQSQTVAQGTAVLLTVDAVGAQPLNYQWRRSNTNLAGETFPFLALNGTTTNANGTYTVVVTNVFGAVTSAPAVLTVTPIFPPVITSQPQNLTVLAGANATFTVTASGTAPFSYQWVKGGVAIPGNDAPTLTLTNATLADAGSYFVQVFNSAGLATSMPATLTVHAPPQFLSLPQPATVLQGATTNFTADASGAPAPVFIWFKAGVRLTNSSGYSGVDTTNLLVLGAQGGQAGSYVVVATNVAGAITSAPVTLTVLLAPIITAHPTNVTLFRASTNYTNALPVTLSVAATGAPPLLYQWRFNGANLPGETNTTFTLTNVTRLSNGLYQAVVTNLVGSAASSNALVRVRIAQRVEPPVFAPGQPFRLRFTDDNGEQAGPADFAKLEVQATTVLTGPGTLWVTLTNGFTVVNGMLQFDDPASTNLLRRYYRVIEK